MNEPHVNDRLGERHVSDTARYRPDRSARYR